MANTLCDCNPRVAGAMIHRAAQPRLPTLYVHYFVHMKLNNKTDDDDDDAACLILHTVSPLVITLGCCAQHIHH